MIIYVEDLPKYLADSKHSEIIAISNGYINSYEFHKSHTQRHKNRKKNITFLQLNLTSLANPNCP